MKIEGGIQYTLSRKGKEVHLRAVCETEYAAISLADLMSEALGKGSLLLTFDVVSNVGHVD